LLRGQLFKISVAALVFLVILLPAFFCLSKKKPVFYPRSLTTVIEGSTLGQIDKLLSERKIVRPGEIVGFDIEKVRTNYWFLDKAAGLEGFLFPDTYEFFLNSSPEVAVRKFLDNFNKKAGPLVFGKDAVKIITLASIIEKEVPEIGEDRLLVSGVLTKRLKSGMPLQVDASICFIKNPLGCGGVSGLDLKIDSPYNTYLYSGLPPTPIANPGLSAIRAALDPKPSPYWFYISSPKTKKTIFAKTLDEHQRNIVKYLGIKK